MASAAPSVFKITPTIQRYHWGIVGSEAKVAQFAQASEIPGFVVDESSPYAELWMGTHVKSPSLVAETGVLLPEHLAQHPELIGQRVIDRFDASKGNLPFLFKVLSIAQALSIQSHPDKKTAEKLHASHPDIYKDPNHKPEMAMAITPFRALCGFRPLSEIAGALRSTPELAALIPVNVSEAFLAVSDSLSEVPEGLSAKAALRDVFAAVMTAHSTQFKYQLDTLVKRYRDGHVISSEDKDIVELVLSLDEQFPGDIGIFCAFLLNYVRLEPGEAIFLGAGEPHAYLSGECMEAMANSDNVIRAGLTPKPRDVPNLISGLTYVASVPSKHAVTPRPFDTSGGGGGGGGGGVSVSMLYDPPIPEFSVVRVGLHGGGGGGVEERHRPVDGPSVVIVTEGRGTVRWDGSGGGGGAGGEMALNVGDVFFIGAGVEIRFGVAGEEGVVLYRAFVEVEA